MCSSALCSLLATSSLQRNCHFRPLLGWKGMALSEEVWDSCITSIPTRVWLRATHDLWWCFPGSSEGPQGSHDPGAFFNPSASRGSVTSLLVPSFPHSTSQPCTTGPEKTTLRSPSHLVHVCPQESHTPWALTNSRRAGCSQHKHLSWLCHHSSFSPSGLLCRCQTQSLCLPLWGTTLQSHPVGLMEALAGSRN